MTKVENSRRVVVVDDHAIVREAVGGTIAMQAGYELVGSAEDGESAIALILQQRPDVAIVDFALPDMTGLEVIECVRGAGSDTRFLLLTGSHMDERERAALAAVADGFMHKEAGRDSLIAAIDAVAEATQRRQPLKRQPDSEGEEGGVLKAGSLTARERDVLREIARGHSVDMIADNLAVRVSTVRKHRENIMAKLGLNSTAQLVRAAMQIGQY
jgi:DNA-binding NarL/FixJ family response regulator